MHEAYQCREQSRLPRMVPRCQVLFGKGLAHPPGPWITTIAMQSCNRVALGPLSWACQQTSATPVNRNRGLKSYAHDIYIYISNKVGLAETMRGVQGLPRCCASLPEKGKIQTKSDGGACFARWRMHNCLFRIKAAAVATLNHAE